MIVAQLKTFVTVVKLQSFSRAAAELKLTQPAVTKQVQALESAYGFPLLARAGRKPQPTEEGKILYQYALEVLRLLADAEMAMQEAGATVKGSVSLGASTIPGQYVLPHLIGPFPAVVPACGNADGDCRYGADRQAGGGGKSRSRHRGKPV